MSNSETNLVGIKVENIETMPGFSLKKGRDDDFSRGGVRYSKIDLDDPGSRTELEILETRALRDEGITLLTKEKFTFMDKFFIIVSYFEETR